MAGVGTTNISLNSLRTAWGNVSYAGGSDPGSANISLSEFRGATFTDGTSVPSSGEISIDDDFKDKTFGSASTSIVYNTGSFRVYDNWSAYSTKLKGTDGTSTFTGSTTANKRIKLYSGQSSSAALAYPIILLTPNATNSSTSPGIIVDRTNSNAVDEATVWFRVVSHNTYGQVQMGIVAKDMTVNNWTNQKGDLDNKHATYCDRLGFHGHGYHNYAGSRDDITSGSTIVSPQYKTGTYGSSLTTNFHNRTGATAGTMRSANAVSAPTAGYTMYFFKNSYANYSGYRSATLNPNHGLKVKWYETTLQVKLEDGSSNIVPVSGNWSASDLTDIFSGMYVSGTGIPTGDGAFIGDIHTNYMVLYKGKGSTALGKLNASSSLDLSNITLTISGYLYWTLTTGSDSSNSNTNYTNAKILGPPHTVLPKYQAASSGNTTSVEIKEWAYYIGDTTSGATNYFDYDLRDTDPGGTAFSYSVSYSLGTIPNAVYPGGSNGVDLNSSGYLLLNNGTNSQSLQTLSASLSTNVVGSSVIGKTGRILLHFRTGSAHYSDIQIINMTVNGSTINIGGTGSGILGYTNWKTKTLSYTSVISNDTYTVGDYSNSSYSALYDVGTNSHTSGYENRRWERMSSGTPGSGGVGITHNTSYVMFESSGPSGTTNRSNILVSPEITFTSNSFSTQVYGWSSATFSGVLRLGVELT